MQNLMNKIVYFSLIAVLGIGLSSCEDDQRLAALKTYVSTLKQRVHQQDPKAKIKAYQLPKPVTFPFGEGANEKLLDNADFNQNADPLVAYPLKSYKFVGTLSQGDKMTAFVLAPNHMTYQIKEGDLFGNQAGSVKKIYNDHIEIAEKDSTVSKLGGEKIVIIKLKD